MPKRKPMGAYKTGHKPRKAMKKPPKTPYRTKTILESGAKK